MKESYYSISKMIFYSLFNLLTVSFRCFCLLAFFPSSSFKIDINAFSFESALKHPGTTSPSFKYLGPVGINSKLQHPSRAKHLHNRNDSSMRICSTSSCSPLAKIASFPAWWWRRWSFWCLNFRGRNVGRKRPLSYFRWGWRHSWHSWIKMYFQ